MAEAMDATDRDGYLLAVCSLDLDHFKAINERHGHAAGDRVLAELANRMRSALRGAAPLVRHRGPAGRRRVRAAAARWHGGRGALGGRAGAARRGAADRRRCRGRTRCITASVGATVYPLDRRDADTLLRDADHAMYGVKSRGATASCSSTPRTPPQRERVLAIGRVKEALDQRRVRAVLPAQGRPARGAVLGIEALLRWPTPSTASAPPQFLPLTENTGLSRPSATGCCARRSSSWRLAAEGLDRRSASTSRPANRCRTRLLARLQQLLARHPGPGADLLELEIPRPMLHARHEATSPCSSACARWAWAVARRLRHRLLVAELPRAAAGAGAEDRP